MKTILLVDNDHEVLNAMSRLIGELLRELKKESIEILKTTSAVRALKISRSQLIDLLITDYRMPGDMNGLQLICRLRERAEMRRVLMSFGALGLHEELATQKGVDEFIRKPIEENTLRTILEKYV